MTDASLDPAIRDAVAARRVESLVEQALGWHRAGLWGQAEHGYQTVLAADPRHATALHLLGILALHTGRPQAAIGWIRRCIEIESSDPVAHLNLGSALLESGCRAEALESFEQALTIAPEYADAWNNHGNALLEMQRPVEALRSLDRALALRPDFPVALNNRGNALRELSRPAEALACYERALQLQPGFARALNNRGNALRDLKRLEEAFASFEQALRLEPGYAPALYNCGNALLELRRYEEALGIFDRLLQAHPRDAAALGARAIALLNLQRPGEALQCGIQAREMDPGSALVLANLGNLLLELQQYPQALECLDAALRAQPERTDVRNNRGVCLGQLKRYREAMQEFEGVLLLAPEYPNALGALVQAQFDGCEWQGIGARVESVLLGVEQERAVSNPSSLLVLGGTPAQQLRCARQYVRAKYPAGIDAALWSGPAYAHERIRVAYLSGDLREHAVSSLIVGVLEHHDRDRIETIGISLRADDGSALGRRVRGTFERCIEAGERSDAQVARWMREQEVDIAVDLMGFTQGLRLGILAQRAAPVQVNYLGYAGTLGAPYMDYLVADEIVIPQGEEGCYAEQVVRLPHCYLPTDDRREIGAIAPSRAEAGLPEQGFVFCAFAGSYKITPQMFEVWMRLLRGVPGSVLWLRGGHAQVCENLRREAQSRDVAAERLVFAAHAESGAEHLARQSLADLFLDTLPYNAHSTACDALWAGVPMLSCKGGNFAGRVGASALAALGLSELITSSLDEYEGLGLELARSPARLQDLRARLAQLRLSAPLFQTERYCRHLEAAYTRMCQRARARLPPAGFAITRG
jgi:predicted O-linked N-acetylglucosamine transferase (SPINDLY family)